MKNEELKQPGETAFRVRAGIFFILHSSSFI
jgi:hypothetical protein